MKKSIMLVACLMMNCAATKVMPASNPHNTVNDAYKLEDHLYNDELTLGKLSNVNRNIIFYLHAIMEERLNIVKQQQDIKQLLQEANYHNVQLCPAK